MEHQSPVRRCQGVCATFLLPSLFCTSILQRAPETTEKMRELWPSSTYFFYHKRRRRGCHHPSCLCSTSPVGVCVGGCVRSLVVGEACGAAVICYRQPLICLPRCSYVGIPSSPVQCCAILFLSLLFLLLIEASRVFIGGASPV
ncbi:uncharacterized protein LOC129321318 isoform X3 [Prosopis cineraria]|uniref:uncharacterized protein LOC129321318 isoform X3 n=1 Tax=Prosopis cineraria TaxID=364024 RepID=UPI00240EF3EA|nr:uncharacterized protein LOC129321318 isoform X3 [Prosopis cineraria]